MKKKKIDNFFNYPMFFVFLFYGCFIIKNEYSSLKSKMNMEKNI